MERYRILKLGLAVFFSAGCCVRSMPSDNLRSNSLGKVANHTSEPAKRPEDFLVFYQGVEGTPGIDFPIYSHIPRTTFSCKGIESGYYADLETDCQVFHICEEERKISFLCPNGTIFQQSDLICEWWFKVNCSDAPNLYEESAESLRDDVARRKSLRRVFLQGDKQHHGAIMRTEEASSVNAVRNGKTYKVYSNSNNLNPLPQNKPNTVLPNQGGQTDRQTTPEKSRSIQYSKPRRFNDNQTGNFVNTIQDTRRSSTSTPNKPRRFHDHQTGNVANTIQDTRRSSTSIPNAQTDNLKEYHVQFSPTTIKVNSHRAKHIDSTTINKNQFLSTTSIPFKNYPEPDKSQVNSDTRNLYINVSPNKEPLKQTGPSRGYQNDFASTTTELSNLQEQNKHTTYLDAFSQTTDNKEYITPITNSAVDNTARTENDYKEIVNKLNNLPSEEPTPNTFSSISNTKNSNSKIDNYSTKQSNPNLKTTDIIHEPEKFDKEEVSGGYVVQETISRKNFEPAGSEESQITQESSSFIKSSLNTIQDPSQKLSTLSYYPNHRTTYSDLKQPNFTRTQFSSTISSVTPHYITTQSINNGKPFLGSRVGVNIPTTVNPVAGNSIHTSPLNSFGPSTPTSTQISYYSEESNTKDDQKSLEEYKTFAKILLGKVTPNPLVENHYSSPEVNLVTLDPQKITLDDKLAGFPRDTDDIIKISSESESTSSSVNSDKSNVLFSTLLPITSSVSTETPLSSTTQRTLDHATIYGTIHSTVPTTLNPNLKNIHTNTSDVTSPYTQGVQIKFNKNVDKVAVTLAKVFGRSETKINSSPSISEAQLSTSGNIQSTTGSSIFGLNPILVSPNGSKSLQLKTNFQVGDIQTVKPIASQTGFFVTKNSENLIIPSFSIQTTTLRPRPFERNLQSSLNHVTTTEQNVPLTYPNYAISSAKPFMLPGGKNKLFSLPTTPTVLGSTSLPDIYQNVDDMINAIMKLSENYAETPRPGLIVPPSAGPQTLNTLAVYFANTLDGIVKDKDKLTKEEMSEKKEQLTTLLTQMTIHGYNHLFKKNSETDEETTTLSYTNGKGENELNTADSNNLIETPEIRQLARNFSIALASYLNNPEMFRKDLEELRPTEPPVSDDNEEAGTDEELLNFSDADAKLSLPPLLPSPKPTWGFIIAPSKDNEIDIKNSLKPDLNTADTQSFIPNYNNFNVQKESKRYPEGHWTTSPSVTKLWSTTFGINPALVNEHFETTSAKPATEIFSSPETLHETQNEIKYELRTLPKVTLNTTHVHGILIDFMNTTTSESRLNRLLKKLNTTEKEFLNKMKEIESNPLTKRLILLLISECGANITKHITDLDKDMSNYSALKSSLEEVSQSKSGNKSNSSIPVFVDTSLSEDDQDTRALQLLNSLYSIASKFGK